MSNKLPLRIAISVSPQTHPSEILQASAAEFAALTAGSLQGVVWPNQLLGIVWTYDLNATLGPHGPSVGLLRVDHALHEPYPAYVSARCFGDVWPPPPLGPADPSLKRAPCARTPAELLALINEVLASQQARSAMESLLPGLAEVNISQSRIPTAPQQMPQTEAVVS